MLEEKHLTLPVYGWLHVEVWAKLAGVVYSESLKSMSDNTLLQIRGQYSGHVICIDQSQASIQAVTYPGAERGQRQTPSEMQSQQDQHTSGQIKTESLTIKRLINSFLSSSTTLLLCFGSFITI